MIRNYLTVAIRNIVKHRFFSIINIVGLVIGMTSCLLIFIYVQDELNYDTFHDRAENIYRVGLHGRIAGQEIYTTNTSLPVGPTMHQEIPGVEAMLRVSPSGSGGTTFKVDDKVFSQEGTFYADSNFFEFFTFPLLEGDAATVLKEPNSIVLTSSLANKYFGEEDPIGKIIQVGNDKTACKVTGITGEVPSNSHFHFQAVISFSTIERNFYQGWTGNSIQTYVLKNSATAINDINSKLEDLVEKYVGKELEEGLGINFDEFRKNGGIYSYYIYPMLDTHLYSILQDDYEPASDIRYVYIFSGVGIFILIIACINFMNLSTARSAGRAKEVGLRKTLGSQRSQMILQFLSESFIYSFVAIVLALVATYLILPQFNLLAGKQLSFEVLTQPVFILVAILLIIVVGVLAGSYPAFYLTSFSAVEVLKGKIRAGMKSKGVRSTLVIVQFALSTFLIIATVVVYKQLSFMQNKNLGLDQHKVVNITNTRVLGENRNAFKNEVLNVMGVNQASYTNNSFPGVNNTTVFRVKGREVDYLSAKYYADWDHLDVMKFTLKEGRFFSKDFKSDSSAVIINEAAVKEFGLEAPLQAELLDYNGETPEAIQVIGVVENFNFESLKTSIRPMVIRLTDVSRNLLVRYNGDPQSVLSSIESLWKTTAPGEPFEYTFLDQDFDALFRAEVRLRDIFTAFSSIAIFIACLGLFALAAFTTEQRTKEIGIRKAMGASSVGLTLLLSKEFTRLVLIAIVPAIAIGWYVTDWWLKDFAYRVEINPIIYVVCALLAIVIAWLTVAYQSAKAAAANPVTSLRYE
jgi:putative ABC transport system permease protein